MSRKPRSSGDMWIDAVEVPTCTDASPIRKLPAVEEVACAVVAQSSGERSEVLTTGGAHGLVTHEHHPPSCEGLASGPDGSRDLSLRIRR